MTGGRVFLWSFSTIIKMFFWRLFLAISGASFFSFRSFSSVISPLRCSVLTRFSLHDVPAHVYGNGYDTRYKLHPFSGYEVATLPAPPAWSIPGSDFPLNVFLSGRFLFLFFLSISTRKATPVLTRSTFVPGKARSNWITPTSFTPGPGSYSVERKVLE